MDTWHLFFQNDMKVRIGLTMAFVLLAPLLGCGGGSSLDLAPVSGTVTYRGKPLDHGSVSFMPTGDTRGPQAAAEIQADGTFSMKTAGKEGAVVGTHKVIVQCRRAVTPVEAKNLIIGELLIPMKYTEFGITPLSINVKSGKNEYPIELK